MTQQEKWDAFRAQLNRYLEPFGLRCAGIIERDDESSWAVQIQDQFTSEYLGKVRGAAPSTIRACLDQGYSLMADFSERRDADIMVVANPKAA